MRWQHSERGDPAARRPAAPILAAGQAGTATRHTQRCRTPYGNCGNGSIILGRRLGGRGNVAETRFTKNRAHLRSVRDCQRQLKSDPLAARRVSQRGNTGGLSEASSRANSAAGAAGEGLSDRLRKYAEEGSRRDEDPQITYRDGPAGRRPLAGIIPVPSSSCRHRSPAARPGTAPS